VDVTLDEIEDTETLRRAAKLLEAENQRLAREISKLAKELHELRGGDPKQLMLQLAGLEQQLANLQKKVFGDSSEKRAKATSAEKRAERQRGHGPRSQPALPIVEHIHVADEADKVCNACGGELSEWNGQFEESEEIDVIERRFVIKKHKRQKYRCRCGQCIETAPGPVKLFEGARYSSNFAISVAVEKYVDHMPLERQVRTMAREGLEIDSQTLWDQLNALAHVLEPVHARLHAYVLGQSVIGADETFWRLMGAKGKRDGGDGKRWQTWAVVAPNAVSYRILDSRSADAAKEVLGDYAGTILCDGYTAYEALQKKGGRFRLAHCWAHVRRKFVEIEDQYPDRCREILDMIAELYAVENEAKTGPPDERRRLRQERSKPIVQRIHDWALSTETLPQSSLGKAIAYMGGIWDGLRVFLDNPDVELDNNGTERALRGIVVGRKNHYGSRSRRGTEVAALFYSLIESAKLAGVGPHTYLRIATDAALRGVEIPLPHEVV
jgi:transposase